jgi:hypothetical protein
MVGHAKDIGELREWADEVGADIFVPQTENERLRAEAAGYKKCWELLHDAGSEMASLIETLGDMEAEDGTPFWEPQFRHLLDRLHVYPAGEGSDE